MVAFIFHIKSSIGIELHHPTVAASVLAYEKLTKASSLLSTLLKSPVVIHEANAQYMGDVNPATILFSFMGCIILAKFVAMMCANSQSVEYVIVICTHSEYLSKFGLLDYGEDNEDVDAANVTDYKQLGSLKMAGGLAYPVHVFRMKGTPAGDRRRRRMLRIMGGLDAVPIPDSNYRGSIWSEIKRSIEEKAHRDEYLGSYLPKYKTRGSNERTANAPETYVPSMWTHAHRESSSSPSSSSLQNSGKKRKCRGASATDPTESEIQRDTIEALRKQLAEKVDRVEDLEEENNQLAGRVEDIEWENDRHAGRVEKLEGENGRLVGRVEELEGENEELEGENEQYVGRVAELEGDKAQLKQENEKLLCKLRLYAGGH